jgi:nitrite reductase/ring-hydroxylating ferredoxin subunit
MTNQKPSKPSAESTLVEVARVAELREGRPVVVMAGGRELLVVQWRGKVFAVRNICPHQSQPLDSGVVHTRIIAAGPIGQVALSEEETVLACPFHTWEFNLENGRCTVDPKLRVRAYPVSVRDGSVFVEMGAQRI